MEQAVFSFVGALIGAILGFLGSFYKTRENSKNSQHALLVKNITSERSKWRADMRIHSAELVSLTTDLYHNNDQIKIVNLNKTIVEIKLRLNPNPDHTLDSKLMSSMEGIRNEVSSPSKNINNIKNHQKNFEEAMQELIKKEWDKSKEEADTGILGKPDSSSA